MKKNEIYSKQMFMDGEGTEIIILTDESGVATYVLSMQFPIPTQYGTVVERTFLVPIEGVASIKEAYGKAPEIEAKFNETMQQQMKRMMEQAQNQLVTTSVMPPEPAPGKLIL